MNIDSICIDCKRDIYEHPDGVARVCKTCKNEFCNNCFGSNCDGGGGQDLNLYFNCPHCSGKIFGDKELLEYLINENGTTLEKLSIKYKNWKQKQGYISELVGKIN